MYILVISSKRAPFSLTSRGHLMVEEELVTWNTTIYNLVVKFTHLYTVVAHQLLNIKAHAPNITAQIPPAWATHMKM